MICSQIEKREKHKYIEKDKRNFKTTNFIKNFLKFIKK